MEDMVTDGGGTEDEQDDVLLNGEFDLEKIEEEIRMEKIRQAASKHSWENFSQYLRKNLMEKRIVLDADDRDDVQNVLSDLRKHMPSEENGDFMAHLRQLADSLSCEFQAQPGYYALKSAELSVEISMDGAQVSTCTVSWFGEPPTEANILKKLITQNKWGTINNTLSVMLKLIPSALQREEKCACMRSLELIEKDLLNASVNSIELLEKDRVSSTASSSCSLTSLPLIDKINSGLLALCQPRTESSPFTIHLIAEPNVFFDLQSSTFLDADEQAISDCSILPCARLSVVPAPTPQLFSDTSLFSVMSNEWCNVESGCRLPATYRLRFSRPIIFGVDSLRKLSSVAVLPLNIEGTGGDATGVDASSAVVTNKLNLYQYLRGEDEVHISNFFVLLLSSLLILKQNEFGACKFENSIYKLSSGQIRNDLLVSLPGCVTQRYVLDQLMTNAHDAGIVREVTFMHPRDVPLIVDTVRTQLAHNALFESLLRAHNPNASLSNALEIRLTSASTIVHFYINCCIDKIHAHLLFVARINVSSGNMSASIESVASGAVLADETQYATSILAKSWSLGVMMRGVLRRGGAGGMQVTTLSDDSAVPEMKDDSKNDNKQNNILSNGLFSNDDVKVSQCWLSVSNSASQHKSDFEFRVADEDTPSGTRSLLALFKELEHVEELIPPVAQNPGAHTPSAPPRIGEMLAPRTSRIHSENTMTINALSDLVSFVNFKDAICDMAANFDDGESNMSEHSGRSSIVERCSPSAVEVQRLRAQQQVPPQSPSNDRYRAAQINPIPQLSPLEIARQRLARFQQTPLSNTPDVFEFDEPPRMANATTPASASTFSPSQQFQFPGGVSQSGYQFAAIQSTRGSMTGAAPLVKRRGRGRKAANIGDRTGSIDHAHATAVLDPSTGLMTQTATRRPRGTVSTRRPRRPRKAAQLAASQTYTHQFSSMERPLLQRSFSDIHYSPQLSAPAPASIVSRSETVSEVDGIEESSDEETDPPPPTRLNAAPAQPPAQSATSLPPPTANPPTTPSSTALLPQHQQATGSSSAAPSVCCSPTTTVTSKQATASSVSSSVASSGGSSTGANTPIGASPSTVSSGHSGGGGGGGSAIGTPSYQSNSNRAPKKSTLEAVVGKLHHKSSTSAAGSTATTPTSSNNPYAASDLYDDESEPQQTTAAKPQQSPHLKREDSAPQLQGLSGSTSASPLGGSVTGARASPSSRITPAPGSLSSTSSASAGGTATSITAVGMQSTDQQQQQQQGAAPQSQTQSNLSQQSNSDLKIMIKLRQQTSVAPTTTSASKQSSAQQQQYPSTISPSLRLTGQPPSSSRSREEKALLKQRQLKEKARLQEERSRKAAKRERKSDSSVLSKKQKLDRASLSSSIEQRLQPPRVELPLQVPAFASLKNFKIPKVMENERSGDSASTSTQCQSQQSSSSTSTNNANVNTSSAITSTPSNNTVSNAGTTSVSNALSTTGSTSSSMSISNGHPPQLLQNQLPSSSTSSIFPSPPSSKPTKSILKSSSVTPMDTQQSGPPPPNMYRSMPVLPMVPGSGRRALLPDPRTVMHHPSRTILPPSRMMHPPMNLSAIAAPPPPSSTGRWMALAPPKQQPSPKNPILPEQLPSSSLSSNTDKSPDSNTFSKSADSPSEALKIVGDDE
ncbi:unnamed protein product [Anisakis simplex]|uniref:Mediator of RNA polymerase II transcription subunit 1 n=1 Tax=Anisakis simplex TaxID=6269 RepID=A0A0M3K0G2_ANISI|nr:unnamed protein product [Anisakis simplex]